MRKADKAGEGDKQRDELEDGRDEDEFAADEDCRVVAGADVAVGHDETEGLEEEGQDVEIGQDWQEEVSHV